MAQTRQYEVTLYPAHIEGGFIVTKFQICGDTYPTRSFEAAGIPDMLGQVERFAMEHGESCRASVRCLSARKPPGFDKATDDLYFNLKEAEQGT